MMRLHLLSYLIAFLLLGCASSYYPPQNTAQGEITLRMRPTKLEVFAEGKQIASSWTYSGLNNYVKCVPQADRHSRKSSHFGRASVFATTLSFLTNASAIGFTAAAIVDTGYWREWTGAAVGGYVFSTAMMITARFLKDHADGHAIDAVNYYNDAVGSIGATCINLTYPRPIGPAVEDSNLEEFVSETETKVQGKPPETLSNPQSPPSGQELARLRAVAGQTRGQHRKAWGDCPGQVIALVAPDSQAARLGLVVGDILLRYRGECIFEPKELRNATSTTQVQESVELLVWKERRAQRLAASGGRLGVVIEAF